MICLKKTIIRNFAEKASVTRKGLQTRALSARGLMRRIIRGKPYVQLRIAQCHMIALLRASLLHV